MESDNYHANKAACQLQLERKTDKVDHSKLQFTKIKPKVGKDELNFGDFLPVRKVPGTMAGK
jgi:hypothetical protein